MQEKTSEPRIKELRISSLWVQALPFAAAATWHEHWWLADSVEYLRAYKEALVGSEKWSLPWSSSPSGDGDKRSHFGLNYLELGLDGDLFSVRPPHAWKHLVPMRLSNPIMHIGGSSVYSGKCRISVEGYVFPYGLGLVVTLYLTCDSTLADAVRLVAALKRGRWQVPDRPLPITLQELAQNAIKQLRGEVLKSDCFVWEAVRCPYEITTFIDAEGVPTSDVEEGEVIHRALDALCLGNGSQNLEEHKPALLGDHCFKLSAASNHVAAKGKGNIIYGSRPEQGIVVWFPELLNRRSFAEGDHKRGYQIGLGRYHRNLTMALLQAKSIISFVDTVSPFMNTGLGPPTKPLLSMCKYGAGICGRMYSSQASYQTAVIRYLIKNKLRTINAARSYYSMREIT